MTAGITIYHADWCPHCKPLGHIREVLRNNHKKYNVDFAEYEADKNEAKVQQAGVHGFPTIHVSVNGQTYNYTRRSQFPKQMQILASYAAGSNKNKSGADAAADTIIKDIIKFANEPKDTATQQGGGSGDPYSLHTDKYYVKYMKYKMKYIELKNN